MAAQLTVECYAMLQLAEHAAEQVFEARSGHETCAHSPDALLLSSTNHQKLAESAWPCQRYARASSPRSTFVLDSFALWLQALVRQAATNKHSSYNLIRKGL